MWYSNGQLNRKYGPAIEFGNGHKHWYKNGKLHREDGPAIKEPCGTKLWYQNGLLHRENGPAEELWWGKRNNWYRNGVKHRDNGLIGNPPVLDGPAVESKQEYGNNDKEWWFNGKLHRENGPAILRKDHRWAEWWVNGLLHRLDGPAVEKHDEDSSVFTWYINGEIHREDGPAIVTISRKSTYKNEGDCKAWYKHGIIHREDGPAKEYGNGHKEWYKHGKLHRLDGPAYESENMYFGWHKKWYKDGKLHRDSGWTTSTPGNPPVLNGPAIEYRNGENEWWVNGVKESKEQIDNRRRVNERYIMLMVFQRKYPNINVRCFPTLDIAKFL